MDLGARGTRLDFKRDPLSPSPGLLFAGEGEGEGPEQRSVVSLRAHVAQAAEHTLGKGGVTGSSPVVGSWGSSSVPQGFIQS